MDHAPWRECQLHISDKEGYRQVYSVNERSNNVRRKSLGQGYYGNPAFPILPSRIAVFRECLLHKRSKIWLAAVAAMMGAAILAAAFLPRSFGLTAFSDITQSVLL